MSNTPQQSGHKAEQGAVMQTQPGSQQDRMLPPGEQAQPGMMLPNPAEPYAPVEIPPRADASSFVRAMGAAKPPGYPKMKYHPVHGGISVKDAGEEGALQPPTDWFDSAELADAARTWTEAEIVRQNNLRRKLEVLDEAGHPIVRNSVQADEALRGAKVEPL